MFLKKNYLEAPSSTNECKNEKDFCGCEDKCVECYNKNTENKLVVQINMEEKKILGSACHLDPFNAINLSSLKLISNLSQKFMMMGKFGFFKFQKFLIMFDFLFKKKMKTKILTNFLMKLTT